MCLSSFSLPLSFHTSLLSYSPRFRFSYLDELHCTASFLDFHWSPQLILPFLAILSSYDSSPLFLLPSSRSSSIGLLVSSRSALAFWTAAASIAFQVNAATCTVRESEWERKRRRRREDERKAKGRWTRVCVIHAWRLRRQRLHSASISLNHDRISRRRW